MRHFVLNRESQTRPPTVLLVWYTRRMDVDHMGRTRSVDPRYPVYNNVYIYIYILCF